MNVVSATFSVAHDERPWSTSWIGRVLQPSAERLIARLAKTLTPAQRAEICLDWDQTDAERGLLRNFIANHWQVTRPCVRSDFFTADQQATIRAIVMALLDPVWHERMVRQLADDTKNHDWGENQSIALIGDPLARSRFMFLFTGRHITLRAARGLPDVAFGGPVVMGHAATGYWEQAHHPGNIFWPMARTASRLYDGLDAHQQAQAAVAALPSEAAIGFDVPPVGVPCRLFDRRQRAALDGLLRDILAPFRAADRAHVMHCLAAQGGPTSLHLAFGRDKRMSAPDWDDWRLQGPSFVWHFQGYPHVHIWAHVAARPDVPVNAHTGLFVHPEHDKLQ